MSGQLLRSTIKMVVLGDSEVQWVETDIQNPHAGSHLHFEGLYFGHQLLDDVLIQGRGQHVTPSLLPPEDVIFEDKGVFPFAFGLEDASVQVPVDTPVRDLQDLGRLVYCQPLTASH